MDRQKIINHFSKGECDIVKHEFPDCKLIYQQMQAALKGVCKCRHNSIRKKFKNVANKKLDEYESGSE